MKILQQKQRGITLILVLACMAIAAALLIVGVKMAVSSHRITRTFLWNAQAQLLAESAMDRAAAQLAADANYTGETWRIPAETLGGNNAGIVIIEVRPIPDQANRRLVKAQADFPDDPLDRIRYIKEITLELGDAP
jgi:Tfp pilus assembly protein PilV